MEKITTYLGLDVGGTSTTGVSIDANGALVAVHRTTGANPYAETAVEPLLITVRQSLTELGKQTRLSEVRGMVVGLAGLLALPEVAAEVARVSGSMGVAVEPLVVNDAEAMFASGTPALDGTVLVAGTGSIAMAIRGGRSAATVDGHGWLLGDAGSAVWIGLMALRSAIWTIDHRRLTTPLADDIARLLEELSGVGCRGDARAMTRAASGLPRPALGAIAVLVDRHAEQGDPAARNMLAGAVSSLSESLAAAAEHDAGGPGPIVVGGSVGAGNATVRRGLEAFARSRWPNTTLRFVKSGAAGAALWARRADGLPYDGALIGLLSEQIETANLDLAQRN